MKARKSEKSLVVGLDVGTSKNVAIVGESQPDGSVEVIGLGSHPSMGLRRDVVVDMASTEQAIQRAVEEAELIGVMFGNPETTTGGNALKFYASQRLDVRRVQALKSGEEVLGNRTRVKVVKNKGAPPFRTAEFDIVYNAGISKIGELIDLGVSTGVLERRGSHFSYG